MMDEPAELMKLGICAVVLDLALIFLFSVCQKTSQLSESKWCVPILEWRRFIIFGRIKVILTVYRLI